MATGQPKQAVATVAPVVVKYVPAEQLVHAALSVLGLYVPALQAVQFPPLGPVYPALHVQLVIAGHPLHEAPEFAGHATHVVTVDAFVATEYFAMGHAVQGTYPFGLISPIEM